MNEDFNNKDDNLNNENDSKFVSIASPAQIIKTVKSETLNKNLSDVIDNLASDEVRRLKKTLSYIDIVEENLMMQVLERINDGTLDMLTAQKILDTLNKSANRSNNIINDKNSSLVQILVDARNQEIVQNNVTVENNNDKIDNIPISSRKKLTKLLDVLLNEGGKEVNDDGEDDSYNEDNE